MNRAAPQWRAVANRGNYRAQAMRLSTMTRPDLRHVGRTSESVNPRRDGPGGPSYGMTLHGIPAAPAHHASQKSFFVGQ